MLGHDSLGAVGRHLDVGDLVLTGLDNLHDGLILADADAAGLCDHDLLAQPLAVDFLHKGVEDGAGAGGDAAGRHAHDDADIVGRFLAQSNPVARLFADLGQFFE